MTENDPDNDNDNLDDDLDGTLDDEELEDEELDDLTPVAAPSGATGKGASARAATAAKKSTGASNTAARTRKSRAAKANRAQGASSVEAQRRRRRTIIAVVMAVVVLLPIVGVAFAASRSDNSSASTTSTAAGSTTTTIVNTTSLDDVQVTDDLSTVPTVTFDPSYVGTEDSSRLIATGTGAPVEAGQRVSIDYVAVSGADGTTLGSTYESSPENITLGGESLLPAIADAITGTPIGSRVVVAVDQTAGSGEWVILAIDIRDAQTLPTSASGEAVAPDPSLPAVTVGADGVPTIATPTGDAPTTLVVQPLITGTGPAVTAGQTVTVQYTGMIWASGQVFDSSWGTGPVDFPIGSGQVIPGFDEGLVGQTVGSRVLLVIPPDKGYGDAGNSDAGIAGTDTLVFVIDILAAS